MAVNVDERSSKKLRILWHSVAPWIASGYGKVTKEICTRLPKHGFDILVSAYYGLEPGGTPPYPITVLPSKEGPFGVASATQYCKQYNINVGILFTDWWAFDNFPTTIPNATLYSPMDQINYPQEILQLTKQYHKIEPSANGNKNTYTTMESPQTTSTMA